MSTQIENLLHTLFSAYIPDPKWYPFIVIGIVILALFLIYFLFSYIRSFIAWVFGVSEVVRLQKEQSVLLRELIELSEEQNNLLYEIYMQNKNFEENSESEKYSEDELSEAFVIEEPQDSFEEKSQDSSEKKKKTFFKKK